jgi:small-conductance mechanosensitive channel
VLGDLFASLSITLDQPFVIGDFIIVDDCLGTVQYIGLKTTRIHSLSGEQIILSNSDLLKCRIRNFKQLTERRVVFGFSIGLRTPEDQVERIPGLLKRIVEALPKTRFDRAHFKSIGDAGLVFEVVYYVLDGDYNRYMDLQQAINLALLRGFREAGLAFSVPARALRMEDPGHPPG